MRPARFGSLEFVVACLQEPGEGGVGLLVGEEGGKPLINSQSLQTQVQPSLIGKLPEAVADPGAPKAPLRVLQSGHRPDPDAKGRRFLPGCSQSIDKFLFHKN